MILKRISLVIVILIISLILFSHVFPNAPVVNHEANGTTTVPNNRLYSHQSVDEVNPICQDESATVIENRTGFLTLGAKNATGTIEDPFILEKLDLYEGDFITPLVIQNIPFHFIINNSNFKGLFGLKLINISSGKIINSKFNDNFKSGLALSNVSNFELIKNEFSGNNNYGFRIDMYSKNIIVEKNEVYDNYEGLLLRDSHNCSIHNNIFTNNFRYDVFFLNANASLLNANQFTAGPYFRGEVLEHYLHTLQDNTIQGIPLQYYKNQHNLNLSDGISSSIFLVNCSDSSISHLTIQNCSIGVMVAFSKNVSVTQNTLSMNAIGVSLFNCSHILIYENMCNDCSTHAIEVYDSVSCEICNNVCSDIAYQASIYLYSTNKSLINQNTCNRNNQNSGLALYYCNSLKIQSNGLYDNENGGLLVQYVTNSSFEDNYSYKNSGVGGYHITYSSHLKIVNNKATFNTVGMVIQDVDYSVVEDNYFDNNIIGINFVQIDRFTIKNNTLIYNLGTAMSCLETSNSIFSNNTYAYNTNIGLAQYASYNNVIERNNFYNNSGCSIYLAAEQGVLSSNNTITNNLILQRSNYAIYLDKFTMGNSIYNNTFFSYTSLDTAQGFDNGTNNNFIYNYWSEAVLVDLNQDGIVDKPYLLDGDSNTQDNQPLAYPPVGIPVLKPVKTKQASILWFSNFIGLIFVTILTRKRRKKNQ